MNIPYRAEPVTYVKQIDISFDRIFVSLEIHFVNRMLNMHQWQFLHPGIRTATRPFDIKIRLVKIHDFEYSICLFD